MPCGLEVLRDLEYFNKKSEAVAQKYGTCVECRNWKETHKAGGTKVRPLGAWQDASPTQA